MSGLSVQLLRPEAETLCTAIYIWLSRPSRDSFHSLKPVYAYLYSLQLWGDVLPDSLTIIPSQILYTFCMLQSQTSVLVLVSHVAPDLQCFLL